MVGATLQALVDALVDGGLQADLDPAKVNLPGVWVSVGLIRPELLDGSGTVEARLNLISRDLPYPATLEALDGLLAQVLDLVDTEGDVIPESVVMPDGPASLPSYRVTVLAHYTRTE
jgi:hypothetical protein